jgi:O-antigen/teichoic acid export membrane protein
MSRRASEVRERPVADVRVQREIGVNRSARSDATITLGLGIIATLLGIPTSILVARALGPAGMGLVTLVATIGSYSATLLTLGVEVSLVHFAGRRPETSPTLARLALRLGTLLGVVASVGGIALLMTVYRDRVPSELMPWSLFLLALGPVRLVTSFVQNVVVGVGRLVEISVISLIAAALTLAGAILFARSSFAAQGRLATLAIVFIVTVLLSLAVARRAHVLPASAGGIRGKYREVMGYGLRAYFGTLLQGVNYRLDFFLVAFFMPLEQVGLYAVGVTATEMLWMVPNNLQSVLMQRAASLPGQDSDRLTRAITRLTSLFLLVSSLVLVLVAAPLIRLVFGTQYHGAVAPLILLLPGTWSLGLWKNLTADLIGRGYPGAKALSAGVAAATTMVLDMLLIPKFGINGAAVASSCAYTVALVMSISVYRRWTGTGPAAVIVPRPSDLGLLMAMARRSRRAQPAG